MGEIVSSQSKHNLPAARSTAGTQNLPEDLKAPRVPPTLADATAAFTFSRLPREQRIARTLHNIIENYEGYKGEKTYGLESHDKLLLADLENNLLPFAEELAKYSVKDFAVRYGHLEDGNAKA